MSKKFLIFLIAGVAMIALVGFIAWQILTVPRGERGLLDILPFGASPDAAPGGTAGPEGQTPGGSSSGPFGGSEFGQGTTTTIAVSEPVVVLGKRPVAGVYGFTRPAGAKKASTTPMVRYVERATGHIYEADLASGTVVRITNTTIPKVYEAYFVEKGEGVILRYLREEGDLIQTWYGKVTPPSKNSTTTTDTIATLEGKPLSPGISALAVSPGTDRIFYLVPGPSSVAGFSAAPSGESEREVFASPAREWLVDWPSANSIMLTSKPSSETFGHALELTLNNGALRQLIVNQKGLTTLTNPAATTALVASNAASGMTFSISPVKEKPAPRAFPAATLPEKCIWSKLRATKVYCAIPKNIPPGSYPDAWYQGSVAFSDSLWLLDTDPAGGHVFIADLEALAGMPVDAVKLALDPEERFLYLLNKTDGVLMAVRIADL